MRKPFSYSISFILPYLLLLILATFILIVKPKGFTVYWMFEHRIGILDQFFYYVTYLGSGLFSLGIILLLLLFKFRYAILAALCFGVSGLVAMSLKNILNLPRPLKYFELTPDMVAINDLSINSHLAFPSGHTTSAFALCYFLTLIGKKSMLSFSLLIIAVLVGISRIYLFQHFLEDVFFGSLIGLMTSYLIYHFIKSPSRLDRISWIDKGVLNLKH
ncbi:MAG: phosphatase PAP2 family protein [Bacteroidetes bacterium]|nr:phosphatase PAP2 family protein [Bacteroidota bacterium]